MFNDVMITVDLYIQLVIITLQLAFFVGSRLCTFMET